MLKIKKAWTLWRNFWFASISPYPLAVFRIFFGIQLFFNFVFQYLPQYQLFFGTNPIIKASAIYSHRYVNQPVFDLLLLLPEQDSWRLGFLIFCALLSILLSVGLFSRVACVLLFLCLLSLNNHFPMVENGCDDYLRLQLLFLCFAPSGAALSLDSLFKKNHTPPELIVAWPQRLMQFQLTYVYLINWIYKVSSNQWNEGSAVYYATRLTQYFHFPLPPLVDTPYGSIFFSWATLVVEFALFSLIWPKSTRYWVILIGIIFHIGLDWCLNLGLFEWVFIASFILFIEPSDWTKWTRKKC